MAFGVSTPRGGGAWFVLRSASVMIPDPGAVRERVCREDAGRGKGGVDGI